MCLFIYSILIDNFFSVVIWDHFDERLYVTFFVLVYSHIRMLIFVCCSRKRVQLSGLLFRKNTTSVHQCTTMMQNFGSYLIGKGT